MKQKTNYAQAIANLLLKNNTTFFSFDPKGYHDPDDIPVTFLNGEPWAIDTVSVVPSNYDSQEKKKGRIALLIDQDGCLFSNEFDGTEKEDFKTIFEQIYSELCPEGKGFPTSEEFVNDMLISEEAFSIRSESVDAATRIMNYSGEAKHITRNYPVKVNCEIRQIVDGDGYLDINEMTVTDVWQNEGVIRFKTKEDPTMAFSLVDHRTINESVHWEADGLYETLGTIL